MADKEQTEENDRPQAVAPDPTRVAARDVVVVQLCERRPGVPAPGEPFGSPVLTLKCPRSMRSCFEGAVQYHLAGRRALNVVFDGRLVQTQGTKEVPTELVVVDDAQVQQLEVRAEQLRLECGRLQVQAETLAESHARMVKLYASEQERITVAVAKAQEMLDNVRAKINAEDGARSDKLVSLAEAERTIADLLKDRVRQQASNLRTTVNQEAELSNEVVKILDEARGQLEKGGRVAAAVDAVAKTGLDVLDHPIVNKAASAAVDWIIQRVKGP